MWRLVSICVLLSVTQAYGEWVTIVNHLTLKLGLTNVFEARYGWPRPADLIYFVDMRCDPKYDLINIPHRPPEKNVSEIHVSIENCIAPVAPLLETFQSLTGNAAKTKVFKLIDSELPNGIPENYTEGLHIRSLELIRVTNFNVSEKFFKNIRDLKYLNVENMEMPHLPPDDEFRLLGLSLEGTSVKKWENCGSVTDLRIVGLNIEQLPDKWPDYCYRLRSLEMTNMTPEAVAYVEKSMIGAPDAMPAPLNNIHKLRIQNCSLDKYPMIFLTTPLHLEELDLSYNYWLDNYFATLGRPQFPTQKELKILNITHANLPNDFFMDLLPRLPTLKQLYLDGNPLNMNHYNFTSVLSQLSSLEHLSVRDVPFAWQAFMQLRFKALTKVNWSHGTQQNIDTLTLYALPSTDATNLEVDLRGHTVKNVIIGSQFVEYFQYSDIPRLWLVTKGYKLKVLIDSVDCDCNNVALATALRDFPQFLSMPNVKCTGKDTLLVEEDIENLRCRRATVNGCLRRIYMNIIGNWENRYTTEVDCSNAGTLRWPRPKGFRGFNASGNSISTIKNAYLPDTLEWLDLSNNNISRLGAADVSRLFAPKRRLWLSGNPIACECDNRALLDALKTYQSMIQDFDAVRCSNNGELLRSISIAELCRIDLYLLWVVLGILAVITAITALMLNHYWSDLRAVLYARGWFLYCLKEEDIDADRPYDAFVSFSHEDSDYVIEHLVPKLEECGYKICVHYRDWSIGEWIPVQIMNSVRASKRTIIVLSKNFVLSLWGALEFRHAYANAIHERRNRLLVLILDDVLNDDLNPELRGYLEKNTYLKCDDPWFWDKLRYSMPHVSQRPDADKVDTISRKMQERSCSINTEFV